MTASKTKMQLQKPLPSPAANKLQLFDLIGNEEAT